MTIEPMSSSYKGFAEYSHVASATVEGGDMQRILPRQLSTGSTRGIQTVGYGAVKIDGTTNAIILTDAATQNTNMTISAGGYQLFTNPSTKINQIIIGKLPDGSYGLAISKTGIDVLTAFS